ncbi:MAG TPA: acyltransferase, partial [Polyangiales bacterium]|nr:acyltransferase [Polyangiales bacterium]
LQSGRRLTMLARENNLDALRFWAAMAVLWSHAVPLTQGSERNELSFRLSGGRTTTGTVAVFVFFALSGYLITRSYERAQSPLHFVRARVLRIVPALVAVLLTTAFVIGPLVSELPLSSYLTSPEPYRYVRTQGTLFFGWADALPGVFTDHPMPVVNGAIWTLRYEAECYGLVFLLGISGLLRKELTLALYVLVLAALAILPGTPSVPGFPPDPNPHLDLAAGFLAGALVYQWQLRLDGRIAIGCVVATLACLFGGQILTAQRTLIPYLALYLALAPAVGRIYFPWRGTDVSYGLYIWAWPLSQLVVGWLRPTWWQMALVTTPLALAAAWLSWTLVEKRALTWKDRPLFGGGPTSTPEPAARHAHG